MFRAQLRDPGTYTWRLATLAGIPYKPPHSTRGYSLSGDPRCLVPDEVHIRGG